MEYVTLGKTGLKISRMGFGGIPIQRIDAAGINISGCFLFQGYLDRYGLGDWAKDRYNAMPVKASACVDCGACETRCPYNLPIRDMLKKCAEEFGE